MVTEEHLSPYMYNIHTLRHISVQDFIRNTTKVLNTPFLATDGNKSSSKNKIKFCLQCFCTHSIEPVKIRYTMLSPFYTGKQVFTSQTSISPAHYICIFEMSLKNRVIKYTAMVIQQKHVACQLGNTILLWLVQGSSIKTSLQITSKQSNHSFIPIEIWLAGDWIRGNSVLREKCDFNCPENLSSHG